MRITKARVQDFRNIETADLSFEQGQYHFFLGQNGQGKTNMLEALSLMTTLRSFRTHESKVLIRSGHTLAQLYFEIDHDLEGPCSLHLSLTPKSKSVYVDDQMVRRYSDIIGRFPAVVFSSDDVQLLRGAPANRRRFMDLILATTDPEYCDSLRSYSRALQERNTLLRKSSSDINALKAYDSILAKHAAVITPKRNAFFEKFLPTFEYFYESLGGKGEAPKIEYKPDWSFDTEEDYLKAFEKYLERDQLLKCTQHGPQRDDFQMELNATTAKQYASEGQQRCLVIALRLAQHAYFKRALGVNPIILADDVLGQLDGERSRRFWSAIDSQAQVFATGTSVPQGVAWKMVMVDNGCFTPHEGGKGIGDGLKL